MELVKVREEELRITIPQNLEEDHSADRRGLCGGGYPGRYAGDKAGQGNSHGQEYFFTKEWQEKEAEADKDIAEGKVVGPFENAPDALRALKKTPQ